MSNTAIDKQYQQEVAHTIFDQLGGKRFAMITGSKDFKLLNDDKGIGITFITPRTRPNLIDRIKIYLSPLDTYNFEFYSGERVIEKNNIYVDNMHDVIEDVAGFYTTLRPRV